MGTGERGAGAVAGLVAALLIGACDSSRSTTDVTPDAGGTTMPADTCSGRADCGPARDDLFDPRRVAELRLTFDPADIQRAVSELRAEGHDEPLDNWLDVLWGKWKHCGPYDNMIPATLQYKTDDGVGDVVMSRVGVRLRGTMSRGRNPVAGMKLHFDAFPADPAVTTAAPRSFAGGKRLNLLSVENDDSLITQCLAYGMMRDFDVPEPRCNHLKVFINGAYYGLLQNADEVDEAPFLRHDFGDAGLGGSHYKCSGGCGYDDSFANLEYLGDKFDQYDSPKKYEVIQGTAKAPEQDLIPMMKCADPVATPDDAAFAACIKDWLDVPEWLRLVAGEALMPALQAFVGAKVNYFLYFRPEVGSPHGGRFSIYSWDYDNALLRESCYPATCDPMTSVAGWYGPAGERAHLITRLTKVFRAQYCAAMNAFLSDVYRPELVDQMAAILDPAMVARDVPYSPTSNTRGELMPRPALTHDAWSAKVAEIRAFITTHRAEAETAVDLACRHPTII